MGNCGRGGKEGGVIGFGEVRGDSRGKEGSRAGS